MKKKSIWIFLFFSFVHTSVCLSYVVIEVSWNVYITKNEWVHSKMAVKYVNVCNNNNNANITILQ